MSWLTLSIITGTALVSGGLTMLVRRLALDRGLSTIAPRDRDIHTKPTPRLGGVAVSVAFLVSTMLVVAVAPGKLHFIDQHIFGLDRNLVGIMVGTLLLLGTGIYDDIRGLKPSTKLLAHTIAGVILAASLVLVPHLTNPFGGKIELGLLTYPFVVAWVVFMVNAINWMDGLDGLASGVSLIATVVLFLLASKPTVDQPSMALLATILIGALAGFLPFNFYPAKIFLGDSGSQVLGFLLAVFSIISGGKLATAFLVLGVPILDVIWVISRRWLTHQPIYQADRWHLHHRLLRAGLNQRQAVVLLYTVSAIFGLIALQTQSLGKLVAALILVGIMVVGGAGLIVLDTLQAKPLTKE